MLSMREQQLQVRTDQGRCNLSQILVLSFSGSNSTSSPLQLNKTNMITS